MTVEEIYRAFQAAVADGVLSGDAPPGLADLLASLGADSLEVRDGKASSGPKSALLTGGTNYLNSSWTMRLTGTPQDGTDRAALLLELTSSARSEPWTFQAAFGELPKSRRPPEAAGGGLLVGPAVIGPLVLDRPAITAGNVPPDAEPRLSGTLLMRGSDQVPGSEVLAGYVDFLGERLLVDGPLAFRPGRPPVIVLRAVAPGVSLELAELEVSAVGLMLTTDYPDPFPMPEPGARRSAALLFAEVRLPTVPVDTATVSGPLLNGDYVWPLAIELAPPLGLEGAVQALIAVTGGTAGDFALPPGIAPLDLFGLREVGFGVVPVGLGGPGVAYASVTVVSTTPWDPPVPFLMIDQVGTQWMFGFGPDGPAPVTGTVFGTMRFGQKSGASLGAQAPFGERLARGSAVALSDIVVTVRLSLPDLVFSAFTEEPFAIPIDEAFRVFFGGGGTPIGADLRCDSLSVEASLQQQEFAGELTVSGGWPVRAGNVTFSLSGLQLQVQVSSNSVSGLLLGKGEVAVPGSTAIQLLAQASYPGSGAWEFSATMVGTLDLPRLVYGLMANQPPDWVNQLAIELSGLSVRFSTADGNPYTASGRLAVAVREELLGMALNLLLTADIKRSVRSTGADEQLAIALRETALVDPRTVLSGSLSGSFTVNRLKVAASVAVTDQGKDYTFEVAYGGLSLRAATAWTGEGAERHQILTVGLTGTLGELLTTLVALANPNATFRLDPPWNFLNGIDLSGLTLKIDPTRQTVVLEYPIRLDLGFARINAVGLSYDRSTGSPAVAVVLDAQLPGDSASKPLSWNPVTQAPPQPPGLGQKLFALRYLGIGQHVSPKDLTAYTSISTVVDAMAQAMRPVDPATGKPPLNPATMVFDAASQWLFGIDATFMGTVAVKLVMHDPDLYGILLALSGPQAGSLAGLSVELLYKKVTDDIGLFHARLQIPSSYRQFQFGVVSVTLGVVSLDIYTNGNFRVDLGFPAGGDFTDSFALEAGYFNGRGGIYFGVLNGATSSRVPKISNGTFSPVLELGVGLSLGVGRTFQRGPLSAGVYVNLVVIFEGALAWFNPDEEGRSKELCYWCRGTVGIVGRLYGTVDFRVVRVDVNVQISAMATVELAAYRKTVIALDVSVRANASIKIVFVRVKFSFSLTLQTSFEIGSDSPTPWRVASGPAAGFSRRALAARSPAAADTGYRLHFDPDARVFPGGQPRTGYLNLAPAYTIANVPVGWTGRTPPPNEQPDHRLVVVLLADNALPPDAVTIAETRRPDVSAHPRAASAAETSFNQLAEGLLRWSINALGVTAECVTLDQLLELVAQLALTEAEGAGFTWSNIKGFLGNNLHLVVSGTPAGVGDPEDQSGTPFPMLPVLKWASTGLPDPDDQQRDFALHSPIDATYEAEAAAYFAALDPVPPAGGTAAPQPPPQPSESMATFVLRDYFRMVARATAQEAVNLLSAYPYQVRPTDSLQSIAEGFRPVPSRYRVRGRDSLDHAAAQLGLGSAELLALNPELPEQLAAAPVGAELTVTIGVTPQSIAVANPGWPVAENVPITLGTLPVRTTADQTLGGLAAAHQVRPGTLIDHLRDTTPLLRAGATVPLPGFVHAGLSVDDTAAVCYVRLGLTRPNEVPFADWYEQAITRLNDVSGALPPVLKVPAGYQSTSTVDWTPLPDDTALDVAAYFALIQNVVPGTPFAAWLDAVRAANDPADPDGVRLPADAAAVIQPNDTLRTLRRRLLDPPDFDGYATGADLLVPLVTVEVPGARGTTGAGLTLLTLGQQYGLGLEDLAGRIARDPGVLAVRTDPLTVPDIPEMELDRLIDALHEGAGISTVSGQVARFMLGGLRLPAPVWVGDTCRAAGPMTGGYQLIGQQVAGPPPPPTESADPVATITVTKAVPADWLAFADATVVDGVLRVAADEADEAVLTITGDDLRDNYPASALLPVVESPLAPLPLAHPTGTRHAVHQVIPWQTTTAVRLSPAASGPPSLWPLSKDLIARAGEGRSTSEFLLEQTTPQTGATANYTELGSYAWATLVSFGVRRIPGRPGTVEVLGADTTDRQLLAQLLDYLGSVPGRPTAGFPTPPPGEHPLLTLLWQLPPSPGHGQGLSSTPLDAERTFIVQTNLSTETRSGPGVQGATAGQHFAAIADAERFLALLWECSVVGGGGYWMQYRGEVPDAIFDQDGLARFSLLIQLSSQCGPRPDRHLFAFTNLTVVGDGVDPASVALTARAVNPPELRPVASVDPGQLGFSARFANPGEDDSAQGLLRRLYGLLGFQLDRTTGFDGSVESRAVSPKPVDGTDELGLLTAGEAGEQSWDLTRVLDISRFARDRLPTVPTAPRPEADPYAGVTAGAQSRVSVRFQDVFGNRSGSPQQIALPVRYTDPVIGVGGWPSTTLRYTVEPAGESADLTVAVELQTIAYQPSAGAPGLAASAAAERDHDRLVPIYYQIMQADIGAALLTSLRQRPGSAPTPLDVDVNALRRYVIGAHALLGSLAAIGSAPADGAATLDAVCAAYGVGYEELGAANADTAISAILDADELAVPLIAAFRNQDTVAGLSGAVDPVRVLLDQDNTVQPLNPAVELTTPTREAVVPSDSPPAEQLAAAVGCSLSSLVTANRLRGALLTPGFVFVCNGMEVVVGLDVPDDATPAQVAAEFQDRKAPYDAVQVVSLNARTPGLFRAGATLQVTGYLVRSGDTLLDNRAGLTPARLAPLNTTTVDLFAPGTPVFLTTEPTPVPTGTPLALFAADHGTTPGELLRHNGSVAVSAGSPPTVPGMWAWPADPDALRVPYTVRQGDSLHGIAVHFPGAGLVEANADMPATVATGVSITVGGRSVTTAAPASFTDVCELFSPAVELGALAAAIGGRTDVLATGALLVCPPGRLPGQPSEGGVTPRAAARPFGVDAVALLAANAGTPGLLLPGQVLLAGPPGPGGTVATETTAPQDTLTALIERFRRRGAVTGVDAVVTANADTAFLRPGARLLVPPAAVRITGRLGEPTSDGVSWSFPEPVFPLTVALELSRQPELVDPALTATATRATTAVPADRGTDPAQDGALTLKAFAEQVQRAVPPLRLATAPGRTGDTDVWAVVFGTGGIERVSIEPPPEIGPTPESTGAKQPRTFAIRPLSTALMARQQVRTPGFNPDTGELAEGEVRDYQGIDLEVWARSFLADAELLLSAGYVQGGYALAPATLDAVIGVKKALAGAIAPGLDYILTGQGPAGRDDPKRAAAVERLRQELLVSLSRGYATSAVVQYDTSATTPWPTPYARLSGSPVADYRDVPLELRTATLSNGKVALTDGDSQINFLVTVPDEAAHAALDLTLDFAGVELEFGIVPEIEGYQRSDWLTFVTPLASGSPAGLRFDLGAPRIPIPLRAYPPMPILLDQQALLPDSPARLVDALHWRYRCAVQHQSVEQDTIELRVSYNLPTVASAAARDDDLFTALARYTAVSAPMLGLLAGLTDWESADEQKRQALANALGSYRTLAAEVADAWLRHWDRYTAAPAPLRQEADRTPDVYRYEFGLEAEDGWYTNLTLTCTAETGPGDVGWPEQIECVTATGDRHLLTPADGEADGRAGEEGPRHYRFPIREVRAFTLLTFELTFPQVHVGSYQNASAATRVTRNARLLGEGWPATADDFVYRTPESRCPEPVAPFIDITGAIAIGPWQPSPNNPLDLALREIFDGDCTQRGIAIGARYAYTLVAADPPVSALLPVVQSTVGRYGPGTVPALTQALDGWSERERPETAGGAWAFRISLYSSVDWSLQRPVLQLRHLSSALGKA